MLVPEMKRIAVWSGRLRLAHWLLAAATMALLVTGGLFALKLGEHLPWLLSVHLAAGYVLVPAVLLRVYQLFFGNRAEHWRDLVPRGPQLKAAGEMLLFYITLGRRSLPAYYAHNPLWAPLHLLLFIVIAAQGASGLILAFTDGAALAYYEATPSILGYTLPELHRAGLPLIGGYTAAHILAVFMHDWRSGGNEISALVGGYKLFLIRRTPDAPPQDVQPVSLGRLRGERAPERRP